MPPGLARSVALENAALTCPVHQSLHLSRCEQSRTVCVQTRTACEQSRTAHVLRSRSVAKAQQNMRSRPFAWYARRLEKNTNS
jgi:hypothetical protein